MNTYIPTIHELSRYSESELRMMFRHAADIAANAHYPEPERAAARQTRENIRRVLASRRPPP
ncbi:hypothetical protein [Achromobacter xylosoxidans]|uniref:hypothetical protein n=1 Tax=Alcaligenes xylosoxydans xylosoxydans TaxID=85698 RepID=UPI001F13245B|nr:hypothetical protein [Achromobacter xylosoxidans]